MDVKFWFYWYYKYSLRFKKICSILSCWETSSPETKDSSEVTGSLTMVSNKLKPSWNKPSINSHTIITMSVLPFTYSDVVIAPVTLHIPIVQQLNTNQNVKIAAQNSSNYGYGAYTGEISPKHLKDAGL